jgi:hypothetical protein
VVVHRADHGRDPLTPVLVPDTDHGDLGDPGVRVQQIFELPGVDVLPTADDHVLETAGDGEVAARPSPDIAGVQPTGRVQGRRRLLGTFEGAQHRLVAACADLARVAAGQGLAGRGIDDLHFDLGEWAPDSGGLVLGRVVDLGLGDDTVELGNARRRW